MRAIVIQSEYDSIASTSDKIIDRRKNIPENIFHKEFQFFLFITFDEILMPLFFNNLKKFLLQINHKKLWVTTIEPDPKTYFSIHFDFLGTLEINATDTTEDYLTALHNYPNESPADAIAHNSNSLVFFSPEHEWAIYGDRSADITICAFSNKDQMQLFQSIYGNDLLGNAHDVAIYAYGEEDNSEIKERFCRSYSVN